MPVTSNFQVYSPDDPNPWRLIVDLAAMGQSVDAGLVKVNKGANLFTGTGAERAAFLALAPRGSHWQDTDGTQREYVRSATSWVEVQSGDFRRGTAGQRSLTTAQFGQIWQDTDGNKTKWKGRTDGSWTRMEGIAATDAGAWTNIGNGNAARTAPDVILPCVLEASETIMLTGHGAGSGYGIGTLQAVIKGPTNTRVSIRQMQLFSSATNAFGFAWQIVDSTV